MAIHPLPEEFMTMHQNIALGERTLVAIAAHLEVRAVLRSSSELLRHDLEDVLIGSYARRVSIWPGKDVDVFGRLMADTVETLQPDTAYMMFGRALQPFADQGRLVMQPRSFKVEFGPGRYPSPATIRTAADIHEWDAGRVDQLIAALSNLDFEFSVDVVPAVRWGEHYGIPETQLLTPTGERLRTGSWRMTSPLQLNEMTSARNRNPRIAGVGAFVRVVKEVKQIKSHHFTGHPPSSLYYEFILHEGFSTGQIGGDNWADLTSSALTFIGRRLEEAGTRPVADPVLGTPYHPQPNATQLAQASNSFGELVRHARFAVLTEERCQAGIEWRQVFGANGKLEHVFPLPRGCRSTGVAMGSAAANVAAGGTAERSFGGN